MRHKGWLGERAVANYELSKLGPAKYHVFHDLYLPRPDGRGTIQIDHIVVSRFGIFFGEAKGRNWTQVHFRNTRRFQNPLYQNALQLRALQQLLGLPKDVSHSMVNLASECEFKTELPKGVILRNLMKTIEMRNDIIISDEKSPNS